MIDSPANPVPAARAKAATQASDHLLAPVAGAYHVREVVDQPITPNDFPRLISLVRAVAPDAGTARELGDGLQWEHDSGFTSLSLTINPEPNGTVIRADLRTDGEQVVYLLCAGGVGLLAACLAITMHLDRGGVVGMSVSALLAAGVAARMLWQRSSSKQAANLQRAVAQIAAGLRGELD